MRGVLWSLLCFLPAALAASDGGLSKWWHGAYATGDWSGWRPVLDDRGVEPRGHWRGIYFGILDSGNGAGNGFSQELSFWLDLDAAQLSGWDGLRGLTGFVEGRWRDPGEGADPNTYVEADSLFNPSRYTGGAGWRLMNFGLRYAAPEFLGVKDGLVVSAGWLQPQKEFVTQPLARLFANNAMGSAEGLGGNIPFGSSFSTWGGVLEVRPVELAYVKGGLYMSYFNPTDPANRGLHFRGSRSEGNGLFFMGETGITPAFGAERLPGSYAFGGYFYGEDSEEFGGNKYGFYWQADQMLWREDGEQGLRAFSLFYFAPPDANDFSFYTQAGLVYQGLVPRRDRDRLMAAVAVGQYGEAAAPSAGQSVVVEAGYRVQLNDWAFVQPFAQFITRPAGTPAVGDAALLGLFLGVDF